MTSQKSSNKVRVNDFKRSFIESLPFPAIALLVLFAFVTVPILQSFSHYNFVSNGLLYSFMDSGSIFYYNFALLEVGMVLCGMMTAVKAFKFILAKKQVNVYFSLGLTRTSLFLNRFLASAVAILLSVFIPITVVLCANIAYLGVSAELIKVYLYFILSLFVCGMVGFSISSLAISVSGCVFEASLTSIAISLFSTILQGLISLLNDYFLKGYIQSYDSALIWDFISPWTFVKPTKTKSFFYESDENYVIVDTLLEGYERKFLIDGKLPEACQVDSTFLLPIVIWLGVALLITGTALLLFNRRKAENSNSVGKFAISRVIIGTSLFCVSLYTGFAICDASVMGSVTLTVIVAAVAAVVYFLTQLILTRKIKITLKSMSACLVLETLFIVFLISLNTGYFGIYNKLPEKENIKSVSLSITGVDYASNIPSRSGEYIESGNPKDIDMTVELFEKIKKDSGKSDECIAALYFKITDDNGKEINRLFKVWSWELYTEYLETTLNSDFFDAVLEETFIGFDENNKSKDGQYTQIDATGYNYRYYNYSPLEYDVGYDPAIMSFNLFDGEMIYTLNSDGEIADATTLNKGDDLAVAIYNDLSKMTYEQLLRNNSKPTVVMGYADTAVFNAQKKLEAKDYIFEEYSYYTESVEETLLTTVGVTPYICVYPEMTETLAYFERNGMTAQKTYEGKVKQVLYTSCRQSVRSVIAKYMDNNEDEYKGNIAFESLKYMYDFNENYFFSSNNLYNDCFKYLGGFINSEMTYLDVLKLIYTDSGYNLTSVDESKFEKTLANCVPQYYTHNDNGKVVFIIYEDGSVVCQYLPSSKLSVLQ